MADLTLKDLLDAMGQLRAELKTDLTKLEAKVDTVGAKVVAHRGETAKGFADLDRELTRHADVHREREKDVDAIKRPSDNRQGQRRGPRVGGKPPSSSAPSGVAARRTVRCRGVHRVRRPHSDLAPTF